MRLSHKVTEISTNLHRLQTKVIQTKVSRPFVLRVTICAKSDGYKRLMGTWAYDHIYFGASGTTDVQLAIQNLSFDLMEGASMHQLRILWHTESG